MRNFKKFLTLVLAVMMVVSAMAVSTSAATFEDVTGEDEYLAEAVDLLNYMGIAKGVSDTKFGTDELVTRQQFALFIYRMMKGGKDAPSTGNNTTKFTDLEDKTYFYAISYAYSQGIINGTSKTTFSPKAPITLQDAYTMVVRALEWEKDEKLAYPYGYIEVAEQDGVALDEGLASELTYSDYLTRGDMAKILYNAFFAETGVAEEVTIGVDYGAYTAYETLKTYPVFCEKAFDVEEVEYQAVATPHYAMNGGETTQDLGYDAIYFQKVDNGEVNAAPEYAYIAAEDLDIDPTHLDDHFLAHFTMYLTLDEDNAVESVLFADSNMTKKTVNKIDFAKITSNKKGSYYEDTEAKLLSGKATADGEVFYFFNAPYSYASPVYAVGSDDYEKYAARNSENIEAIAFNVADPDAKEYNATVTNIFEYEVEEDVLDKEGNPTGEKKWVTYTYDVYGDEFYTAQAEILAAAFEQAYYGGLFEADLYDVDGDGIYDYIDYKPYTFFQLNDDEDYNIESSTEDAIPVVYTYEATVTGEKYEDEDYVLGYYSVDDNMIHVAAVVKPVEATVKGINDNTITLSDGSKVVVDGGWKLVTNFAPESIEYDVEEYEYDAYDALLTAAAFKDEAEAFYVYNGVLLYTDVVATTDLEFTGNLLIPVSPETGDFTESSFDPATGKQTTYMHAWVDGTLKYVPVDVEETFPEIDEFDYEGVLCTYSVSAEGLYVLKALGYVENEDGEYKGMNKDDAKLDDDEEEYQVYVELGDDVTMEKISGTRYELGEYVVNLKDNTKIVIMNTNTAAEEIEWLTYTASDFSTPAEALDGVVAVIANNPDSSRENLVLLFAVATDFEFASGSTNTASQRIIGASAPAVDANGYYRNYYTVINPFTGLKESEIPGNKFGAVASDAPTALAPGRVALIKDGKVDEKGFNDAEAGNLTNNAELVWILDYSESDKVLEVAEIVENWYDAETAALYQVDDSTVVTSVTYTTANAALFTWGTVKLHEANVLASDANSYKCYNAKVEDNKGGYKTGYAMYKKAYVVTSEINGVNANERIQEKVDYVVILVHPVTDEGSLKTTKKP